MMGTSAAIFNRRAGGHFVKLTIFHYIPSDKHNNLPAHHTRVSWETTSQLKDKTMNKYGMIFGVVMFAAGFFAHSAFSPSTDTQPDITIPTDNPATMPLPDKSDAEKLALKKQIAKLEAQVAMLTQRMEISPSAVQTTNEREVDADSLQPKVTDTEFEKMQELMAIKVKEKAQAISRWSEEANKKPGGVVAVMGEKFSQEKVDDNWAASQETKLYDKFSIDEKLAELPVTETQCKTTLCRVSIAASDTLPDFATIAQLVSDTGANAGFSSYMTVLEPEAGLVHIYFNKEPLDFQKVTIE